MRRRQEGQAVVGAMVVMLILFALAGAVAIGATTLLAGQRDQGAAFRDDLTVQSAVSDAAAQVAGSKTACSTSGATLGLQLPNHDAPASSNVSSALCTRVDDLQLGTLDNDPLNWAGSTPGSVTPWRCMTLQLPGNKVAVAFDARSSLGGWAYVDKVQITTCDTTPPTTPTACQQTFNGSTIPVQVSMNCQFATFAPSDRAYLHIRNSEPSPARVFVASRDPSDPQRGSIYMLALRSGLPQVPAYDEEALVQVDSGNATTLRYEGRLP